MLSNIYKNKKIIFEFKNSYIDILIGSYSRGKIDIFKNIRLLLDDEKIGDESILDIKYIGDLILKNLRDIKINHYQIGVVINSYSFLKIETYPIMKIKDFKNLIKNNLDNVFNKDLGKLEIDYIYNRIDESNKELELLYFAVKSEKMEELRHLFNYMDIKIDYIDHKINTILKSINMLYSLKTSYIYIEAFGDSLEIYSFIGGIFIEKYRLDERSVKLKELLDENENIIIDLNKTNLEILSGYESKILIYRECSISLLGGLIRSFKYSRSYIKDLNFLEEIQECTEMKKYILLFFIFILLLFPLKNEFKIHALKKNYREIESLDFSDASIETSEIELKVEEKNLNLERYDLLEDYLSKSLNIKDLKEIAFFDGIFFNDIIFSNISYLSGYSYSREKIFDYCEYLKKNLELETIAIESLTAVDDVYLFKIEIIFNGDHDEFN